MRMADCALIRSLRPASCWRVEVMNGGCGFDVNGFEVTEVTSGRVAVSAPDRAAASTAVRARTSRWPVGTPWAS